MLLDIRDKAQSWIAWLIVILISIPFALWGINSYFGGGGDIIVAKINDDEITHQQYQRASYNHRQRLRELLKENFKPELLESKQMRMAILNGMIDDVVIRQHINNVGFAVSNQEIADTISQIPQFQKDGKFDKNLYKQIINSQGQGFREYESSIRHNLLLEQFQNGLANSSFVLEGEVNELSSLLSQVRNTRTSTLDKSQVQTNNKVSDEEIQTYYENNRANYYEPEAVKISFVELKVDQLAKEVSVDDKILKDIYAQNKAGIKGKEQRRLSHIMLVGTADKDKENNLKRINEIKDKLNNGSDFAKLAKDFSEDPGTAAKGGDLGFYAKGGLDPAIEAELFQMEKNQISQPILSKYGYHLIKMTDIRVQEVDSFTAVKDELRAEEQRRIAQEIFFEKDELLANLAYEQPDSLDALVTELELDKVETDWVSNEYKGDDILAHPKVQQASFSDIVLKDGQNSEVLEISDEHRLVLRVNEHRPKSYQELAKVKDKIRQQIINDRLRNILKAEAEKIISGLKSGQSLAQASGELNLSWSEPTEQQRDGSILANKVFAMAKPNNGKPEYASVNIGEEVVIIMLDKISSKTSENDQQNYTQLLKNQRQNINLKHFVAQLKSEADIQTFPEKILEN